MKSIQDLFGARKASKPRHSSKHPGKKNSDRFHQFAQRSARVAGKPITFGLAILLIVLWAIAGPLFQFSNTWQLVINTTTTIVTFLMVFVIQNTQNRDSEAMQLKLDELIRATKTAHTALLDVEELSEEELDKLRHSYQKLAREALREIRAGKSDLNTPHMDDNTYR